MQLRYDKLMLVGATLIILGLIAFGISSLPPWFAHPLGTQACEATYKTAVEVRDCKGYNVWSGVASDLSELTIVFGMVTFVLGWWYKHNCHVPGCPRLQWHSHPDHGHPVCKKHHPHSDPDHAVWDMQLD